MGGGHRPSDFYRPLQARGVRLALMGLTVLGLGVHVPTAGPTEGTPAPKAGVVRVLDEAGRPVPQAPVWLVPCDPGGESAPVLQGTTDAEGRAEFPKAVGRYDLLAWDETRSRVGLQECGELSPGGVLTVRLQKAGILEGEVVSEAGVAGPSGGVVRAFHWKLRDRWSGAMTYDREPLFAWTASPDTKGQFRISGLLPGAYRLMAYIGGYTGVPSTVTVSSGQTARVRLRVIRGGAQLDVRVVDLKDQPVPNARVSLLPLTPGSPAGRLMSTVMDQVPVTDKEGRVTLYGLPAGVDFQVLVRAPGRGVQLTEALRLSFGESASRIVRLVPGHEVIGVAVDEDGSPIREVRATVRLQEGDPLWRIPLSTEWQAPDEKGRFRIGLIPPVSVEVVLQASGYQTVRQTLRLTGTGARHDLGQVVFRRGATIEGRVVDDTGAPVPNARITAYRNAPLVRDSSSSAVSKADGTFVVGGLEPDTGYLLSADASGYVGALFDSLVVPSNSKGVTLTLLRAARIRGRVLTGDKKPAPFFSVHTAASPESAPSAVVSLGGGETFVTTDGVFELREVVPGRVWVHVEVPDYGARDVFVSVRPGETKDVGDIIVGRGCDVRVRVQDASGRPVVLASIVVIRTDTPMFAPAFTSGDQPLWTDERGYGSLGVLEPGRYEVTVTHPDYAVQVQALEVSPACEARPTDIVLKPGGRLHVCVTGEQDTPVAGALVRILQMDPQTRTLTYSSRIIPPLATDSSGCVTTPLLPEGTYQVSAVRMMGEVYHREMPVEAEVQAGTTREVVLRLCSFVLTGRVLYGTAPLTTGLLRISVPRSSGLPAWASVSLKGEAEFRVCTQASDRYGFFYESLDGSGTSGWIRPTATPDAAGASVEIRIPTTRMDVRVVAADTRAPVQGAQVSLQPREASADGIDRFSSFCRTRADGTCTLIGFSPTSARLVVERAGYASFQEDWDDLTAVPPVVEVALSRGGTLQGRVTDSHGNPLRSDIEVWSVQGDQLLGYGRSLGEYTVQGLPMGRPVSVVVSANGYAPAVVEGLTLTQEVQTLDIRLSPGAPLRVQVVDAQGRPVAGAQVILRSLGGLKLTRSCGPTAGSDSTDERGILEFRHAPTQGSLIVEAQKEGRQGGASVTLVEGVPGEVRVVLPER